MSSVVFGARRRDLAWALALVVLLSAVWVARGDQAEAGGDPPGVGIAVVYVAVGTGFPDSLGVGPGGGVNGAPIIIVPTNPPIPTPTSEELVRLDPRRVVIVGGIGVVSEAMEEAIGALLPNALVERIAGANRYETNALFSEAVFPVEAWVAVPPAAFTTPHPDADDVDVEIEGVFNVTTGYLLAPLHLPDGAEILELKVIGYDNSGDIMNVQLHRLASAQQVVAAVASVGEPGVFTTSSTAITAGMGVVSNEDFSYLIGVTGADGDPYLINVMVRYRLGAPGPTG